MIRSRLCTWRWVTRHEKLCNWGKWKMTVNRPSSMYDRSYIHTSRCLKQLSCTDIDYRTKQITLMENGVKDLRHSFWSKLLTIWRIRREAWRWFDSLTMSLLCYCHRNKSRWSNGKSEDHTRTRKNSLLNQRPSHIMFSIQRPGVRK